VDLKGPTSKAREGKGSGRGREGRVRKIERGGESVALALILQFDHY